MPAMMRANVVLPPPFGPVITTSFSLCYFYNSRRFSHRFAVGAFQEMCSNRSKQSPQITSHPASRCPRAYVFINRKFMPSLPLPARQRCSSR